MLPKIKNVSPKALAFISEYCENHANDEDLIEFLNPNTTIIPVPSHAPREPNWVWPSREIARAILRAGIVNGISTCLTRITKVQKSAFCKSVEDRPSPQEHFDSIQVENIIIESAQLVLVDDLITIGSTMLGCAWHLERSFPGKEIKCFSPLRPENRHEIQSYICPTRGTITYTPEDGRLVRFP